MLAFTIDRLYMIRNDFADRYLAGEGYEIGAQKSPIICKKIKKVRYIDYLTREESARKYNLPVQECVEVDIIADASDLEDIPSRSASFLIANHVLEHCPDPITTLAGWLRIIQPGGILFLTLPNYRANEFDFEKKPTSLSHMERDAVSARMGNDIVSEHIREHVTIIDGIDPADTDAFSRRFDALVASNLHTHYHVFDRANAFALLRCIHGRHPVQIINFLSFRYGLEHLFILKKMPEDSTGTPFMSQERMFKAKVLCRHAAAFILRRLANYVRSRRR
jgi:SAM-dependent methyltransferase